MRKPFYSFLITVVTVATIISCSSNGKSTQSEKKPKDAVAVDLGLPSGTKWANMNVGATTPYDPGSYFQWGETTQCNDTIENVWELKNYTPGGTVFTGDSIWDFGTKYDPMFVEGVIAWDDFGFSYGDIAGNPKYDAATANWGDEWSMPTLDQINELLICCEWTSSIRNGITIYKVVGPSGDSILLPGTSYKGANMEKEYPNSAVYWSSTLGPDFAIFAHLSVCVPNGIHYSHPSLRNMGCNVRPVIAGRNRMKEATPEAVDLALPSGTKWANINLGACAPEEYGDYFQWGETTPCTNPREHLSMVINYTPGYIPVHPKNFGTEEDPMYADGYIDEDGWWCCNIAGKTKYDAATANWGQQWRMPTKAQMEELVNECEWIMCSLNGVNGARVVGKNGNHIFLPAAGGRSEDIFYSKERYGHYWSGECLKNDAYCINFLIDRGKSRDRDSRREGFSVRPVLADARSESAQTTAEANQKDESGIVAVDLGLPSGTKWANMNVGASGPDSHGEYFAWGDVDIKDSYNVQNYAHFKNGTMQDIGNNIAGTVYDVARTRWGGDWHMPTKQQFEELIEKCTWEWEERDNSDGYKVTGPSGKSIFLPAAYNRSGDGLPGGMITFGEYWTATAASEKGYSWVFTFSEDEMPHLSDDGYQPYGLSVRPVKE